MTPNVGSVDRVVRLIVGLFLILAPLTNMFGVWESAVWAYLSIAVGLVLTVTALIRFCLLYRIFGITTAHPT